MLQAACFGGMNERIHAVMQERSSSLVDVGVGGASMRTACCSFRAEDANNAFCAIDHRTYICGFQNNYTVFSREMCLLLR